MQRPTGTEATSPGMRPALLSEVAGTLGRSVVPACPFGGAHDDATVSYLLSQTLLAEQEAKEVEELEAKLADREHRLLMSCSELCGRFAVYSSVSGCCMWSTRSIGFFGR